MADNNTPVNPTEEELLAVERMLTGEAAPQAAAESFAGQFDKLPTADQQSYSNIVGDAFGFTPALGDGITEPLVDEVAKLPGGVDDFMLSSAQSAARGATTLLDIPPMVWNASGWILDKVTPDSAFQPAYIDYPSDIISEVSGIGDASTQLSANRLKAAGKQTLIDLGLADESILQGQDFRLPETELTDLQQTSIRPLGLGLEIMSGGGLSGALGKAGAAGSLSRGRSAMLDGSKTASVNPYLEKIGDGGGILPRNFNDFRSMVPQARTTSGGVPIAQSALPRFKEGSTVVGIANAPELEIPFTSIVNKGIAKAKGEATDIPFANISTGISQKELKYSGISALGGGLASAASGNDPMWEAAGSILFPSVGAVKQMIKQKTGNVKETVEMLTSQEGQALTSVDLILSFADDKALALQNLDEAIKAANGKPLTLSLGMATKDPGLIALENGRRQINTDLRNLDDTGRAMLGGMLNDIADQGLESVTEIHLKTRLDDIENRIQGSVNEAVQEARHAADVAGTPLSTEEAGIVLRDGLDVARANAVKMQKEAYDSFPDATVNAREVLADVDNYIEETFTTQAAKENFLKGFEDEYRILQEAAGATPAASVPNKEAYLNAVDAYKADLVAYKESQKQAKAVAKQNASTEYKYTNIDAKNKSFVDNDGQQVELKKLSQEQLEAEGLGYTGDDKKTGAQWAIVDNGRVVDTRKTLQDIKNSVVDNYGQKASVPEPEVIPQPVKPKLEDFATKSDPKNPNIDISEIIDLRSLVMSKLRSLPKASESAGGVANPFNRAFGSKLQEAMFDSITSDEYGIASAITKKIKATFDDPSTVVRAGDEVGQLLNSKIFRRGDAGAKAADELLRAAEFAPGVTGMVVENVKASFASSVFNNGAINKASAEKFLDAYAPFLRRPEFKAVREQLEEATIKGNNVELAELAAKKSRKDVKQSVAHLWINADSPNKAIDSIIRGKAGKPGKAMDELIKQVSMDKTGKALEGLRSSFISRIVEDGRVIPYRTRKAILPELKKLFGEDKGKIIDDILKKNDEIVSRPGYGKTDSDYQKSLLLSTIGKVLGAKIGAQFGQSPLIMANVGGRVMEKVLEKIPQDKMSLLVDEMLLDPTQFASYVKKVDKIKNVDEAVAMVHQWLLIAGVQTNLSIRQANNAPSIIREDPNFNPQQLGNRLRGI